MDKAMKMLKFQYRISSVPIKKLDQNLADKAYTIKRIYRHKKIVTKESVKQFKLFLARKRLEV